MINNASSVVGLCISKNRETRGTGYALEGLTVLSVTKVNSQFAMELSLGKVISQFKLFYGWSGILYTI